MTTKHLESFPQKKNTVRAKTPATKLFHPSRVLFLHAACLCVAYVMQRLDVHNAMDGCDIALDKRLHYAHLNRGARSSVDFCWRKLQCTLLLSSRSALFSGLDPLFSVWHILQSCDVRATALYPSYRKDFLVKDVHTNNFFN